MSENRQGRTRRSDRYAQEEASSAVQTPQAEQPPVQSVHSAERRIEWPAPQPASTQRSPYARPAADSAVPAQPATARRRRAEENTDAHREPPLPARGAMTEAPSVTTRPQTPASRGAASQTPPPAMARPQSRTARASLQTPPPAMARPPKPTPRPERAPRRMPIWLWITLVIVLVTIGGQWYARAMMQSYLDRREEERVQAHQKLLDAHPVYYADLIRRYADEYNLEPAYIAAIILNESSFRKDAESNVGARGLMQLMPSTAEWIAGKLKISGYSFDRMYDPESNIRFGAWYLNYLSGLYRGDPVCVTAAYHAGQGEINGWLSDKTYSDDGITIDIDRLPDGPTKTYVRRVTRDFAIYSALFANPDSADDGTLLAGSLRAYGEGQ